MDKEIVFVHVPKTGGASILQLCLRHGIRIIDHDLRNPNYISLTRYRSLNPNIYSFAIVRNPWDRVVSSYHYLRKGGIKGEDMLDADRFVNQYRNFTQFVLNAFEAREILDQIHFRPQYKWISDERGVIVDMVGRFERLQTSFSKWCKTIGLPNYKLPHVNRSAHRSYKEYFNEQTIEVIRKNYRKDIELFKYKF